MFNYYFSQFQNAGKYAIAYIFGKNEFRTEAIFDADSREELEDKWRMFVKTNGLSIMCLVGIDKIG